MICIAVIERSDNGPCQATLLTAVPEMCGHDRDHNCHSPLHDCPGFLGLPTRLCLHEKDEHGVVRINSIPTNWCMGCARHVRSEADDEPEHAHLEGERCPTCDGLGRVREWPFDDSERCPDCKGLRAVDKVEVDA